MYNILVVHMRYFKQFKTVQCFTFKEKCINKQEWWAMNVKDFNLQFCLFPSDFLPNKENVQFCSKEKSVYSLQKHDHH